MSKCNYCSPENALHAPGQNRDTDQDCSQAKVPQCDRDKSVRGDQRGRLRGE